MSAPVLVLGGSGGVGSALARLLVGRGGSVHLLARDKSRLNALSEELGGVPFTSVDILDSNALKEAVEDAAGSERGVGGHQKGAALS